MRALVREGDGEREREREREGGLGGNEARQSGEGRRPPFLNTTSKGLVDRSQSVHIKYWFPSD